MAELLIEGNEGLFVFDDEGLSDEQIARQMYGKEYDDLIEQGRYLEEEYEKSQK